MYTKTYFYAGMTINRTIFKRFVVNFPTIGLQTFRTLKAAKDTIDRSKNWA